MFVKMYVYYIEKDKTEAYFDIQKEASKIYGKYLDFQTIYLRSNEDETKWVEITKYKSEEEYNKSIELVNEHKEIQELFNSFQAVLLEGKNEITEENFTEVMDIHKYK
ncbi:MAG: hypothetical protein ACI35O_12805 [Bacillaceae bacterium]